MAGITLEPSLSTFVGVMNITYVVASGETEVDNNTVQDFDSMDICSGPSSYHKDLTQIPLVTLIVKIVYSMVIFLAILGNVLVIWTVIRNKYMHTVTNYYIVNLACSDLLVTAIVMPLKLLEYTAPCEWHVFTSDTLCAVLYYLLPIFVFASVLTLVAISLERYYAIVHPLSAMKINSKSRTRKIIATTWLIPIVLASPYLYCRSFAFSIESELGQISRQICTDRFDEIDLAMYGESGVGKFRRGYFIFLFLAVYLIPMVTILVTCIMIAICLLQPICIKRSPQLGRKDARRRHEENKRKVARMVIVIACAFIVAWSPQYLVSIISQLQSAYQDGNNFLRESNFLFTMLMTHLCGFVNSCINPFIYCVMSKKFRRSFKQILVTFVCCCVSKRIFRYQDSMGAGNFNTFNTFTQTNLHNLSDIRDPHDCHVSEGASSGGSSSGGASQQGRNKASRKKGRENKSTYDKGGWKTTAFGRSWNSGSNEKAGYNIMLKCLQKESIKAKKDDNNATKMAKITIDQPETDTEVVQSDSCPTKVVKSSSEFLNKGPDTCSDSIDSDVELANARDQINAIREEHEHSLKPINGLLSGGIKHSHYIMNGQSAFDNCVRL